jgi:hypothetical protein
MGENNSKSEFSTKSTALIIIINIINIKKGIEL